MLNITRLIDFLEAQTTEFDMTHWLDPQDRGCGTIACIGGSACVVMGDRHAGTDHALEWILKGLDPAPVLDVNCEGNELFFPMNEHADWEEEDFDQPRYVSRARAIAVLEHLRDTSNLDWSIQS